MALTDEEQVALRALERFTAQVTVPVLYDDPTGVDQVGTGTLFALNGKCFLVTAAHLFDDKDPGRFAIPKSRANSDLHSLGPFMLYKTKQPEFDIAILELQDQGTIAYARAGWRVVELKNTGRASPAGVFVLCGYPSVNTKRSNDLISGRLVTIFTERLPEIPAGATAPVHPGLDLFFHYDVDAPGIRGETVATPHLRGTSGASVWEYQELPVGSLWAPERTLRIVGVQSSFLNGQYFRAKSWDAVLEILRQADPSYAAAIDAHL